VKVITGRRGALKKFALTAPTGAISPASVAARPGAAAAEPALTPPGVLVWHVKLASAGDRLPRRSPLSVRSGEFEIRSPRMNYIFSQLSRRVSPGGTANPIWERPHEA
jgi:hypothetical protein